MPNAMMTAGDKSGGLERGRVIRAFSLGLCLLTCLFLSAGSQASLRLVHLGLEDGLIQSRIMSVQEDQRGYIWLGTEAGVNLYDGYEVSRLKVNAESESIALNFVNGFHPSGEHEMWVATLEGVALANYQTGTVHYDAHEPHVTAAGSAHQHRSANSTFIAECDDAMLLLRARHAYLLTKTEQSFESELLFTSQVDATLNPHLHGFVAIKDRQETIWLSDHRRLWRKPCGAERFDQVAELTTTRIQSARQLSSLALDASENVLWGTHEGIYQIQKDRADITPIPVSASTIFGFPATQWSLANDSDGRLWVITDRGVGLIERVQTPNGDDQRSWRYQEVYTTPPSTRTEEDVSLRLQIFISGDGLAWLSIGHDTLVIDLDSRRVVSHLGEVDELDLSVRRSEDSERPVYQDRFGVVWLSGSLGGISRYVPERNRFCSHQLNDQSSQSVRAIERANANQQDHIWVSSDRGWVSLGRIEPSCGYEVLKTFNLLSMLGGSARSEIVRSMSEGQDGQVWMISGQRIWRGDTKNQSMKLVSSHVDFNPDYFQEDYVDLDILYDSQENRLIYTTRQNLRVAQLNENQEVIANKAMKSATPYLIEQGPKSMVRLSERHIALILTHSLLVVDIETDTTIYHPLFYSAIDGSGLILMSMVQDPMGRLWLGTRQGLYLAELSDDYQTLTVVRSWTVSDGLADDVIYGVLVASPQSVWVSTNRGLSRIFSADVAIEDVEISNFGLADGLPTYEFNSRATYQDSDGQFFFGSINGFVSFSAKTLALQSRPPVPWLRQVEVNANAVKWNTAEQTKRLAYDENNLTVHYTGIHTGTGQGNQYAFRLEGLQDDWVQAGQGRIARFYQLPPGEYHFWLKAANGDGNWSEPTRLLSATIQPPPWATDLAYGAYTAAILLVVMLFVTASMRRRRELERLVVERTKALEQQTDLVAKQADALEQALEARTLFFANISHEFRTPLTLIQAAVDQLEPANGEGDAKNLAMRYLQRLTRLVNQLLDLSRLRLSGTQEASEPWSVNHIVLVTVDGFQFLAEQRHVALDLKAQGFFETRVDQASVEKILLNLVSNALKYTEAGDHVTVSVQGSSDRVQISVADTGQGIEKDQQAIIFERFERVPSQETLMREGSGIGLALVKEAVNAIGGSIVLESTPGEGACFTVEFPAVMVEESTGRAKPTNAYLSGNRLEMDQSLLAHSIKDAQANGEPVTSELDLPEQSILVVEDNKDLRQYLAGLLSPAWRVYQAEHGKEALEVVASQDIDVILADIMMPEMDGLTLLKHLREDFNTSHIPFLLLSARHDAETRLLGLTLAADDFLTKPFLPEELKLKLRNVMRSRALLRQAIHEELRLSGHVDLPNPTTSTDGYLSPNDHKFLKRLEAWIETHYGDPEFSVSEMASDLAVNERTLQRKIRALTDLTPVNFVNRYRLQKAKEALRSHRQTIQEIAFSVGFNSQQSFARAFKQHFGITPSQWRQGDSG